MTLYETIEKNAVEKPDDICCKYFNYTMTYNELLLRIRHVAGALIRAGFRKGDRIGISLPNSPDLLAVFYAVNQMGGVCVMFNPKSPSEELARQLRMTDCKCLFFSRIAIDCVYGLEGFENLTFICVPIMSHFPIHIKAVLTKRVLCQKNLTQFKKKFKKAYGLSEFIGGEPVLDKETDDLSDAVIIFSGGTNGTFKAVVHSSASFEQSAINCLETEKPLPKVVSMLAILPAFHIFGLTVAIHLPLYAGGMVVMVPVFNLGIVIDIIKKDCPAYFPGVPTIFERLLVHPGFSKLAAKGKLNFNLFKHGFVGGDNLTDDVRDDFNRIIRENGGNGYISMGYGMSECCPICVNNRTTGYKESVGIPFDDMQIRIMDENSDTEILNGDTGEIAIASGHLMSYGFDEEGSVTRPFVDAEGVKWLRTGDVGYIKDGIVYYKCRQRRIIKVSGNTVFASSIEKILHDNLDIAKAAYVVPVPHSTRGYGAFAFVVTNKEINDDELLTAVRNVCKNRMIPYAIPIGAAHISDKDIPYTAIGKVAWGLLEKKAKKLIK